jgi:hypothetical protein
MVSMSALAGAGFFDKRWKKVRMMNARTVVACAFAMTIGGNALDAHDVSRYRTFQLGTDVADVSDLTGVASSEAKTVHQRPALLQDLEWRPSRWTPGSSSDSTDPVDHVVFSFYDDQLFRIVVDYGYDRTEGMTDADMIEAISAVYGTSVKPARGTLRVQSQIEIESGSPVARWGNADGAVVLYRTSSYREAFRLIVTDPTLADLARKAATEAVRLDEQQAPQREIARQKKERDDARVAAEKARAANKGLFWP